MYLQQSNESMQSRGEEPNLMHHHPTSIDQKAASNSSGNGHLNHPMPVVQLEISADGFEVTQNSVKFLPHGIQFSVGLPPCLKCNQPKFGRRASGDAPGHLANGGATEPEQLKDSTGSDHQAPQGGVGGGVKQNEIKFLLKLSNEHTESQFSHIARQPSIRSEVTKQSTPGALQNTQQPGNVASLKEATEQVSGAALDHRAISTSNSRQNTNAINLAARQEQLGAMAPATTTSAAASGLNGNAAAKMRQRSTTSVTQAMAQISQSAAGGSASSSQLIDQLRSYLMSNQETQKSQQATTSSVSSKFIVGLEELLLAAEEKQLSMMPDAVKAALISSQQHHPQHQAASATSDLQLSKLLANATMFHLNNNANTSSASQQQQQSTGTTPQDQQTLLFNKSQQLQGSGGNTATSNLQQLGGPTSTTSKLTPTGVPALQLFSSLTGANKHQQDVIAGKSAHLFSQPSSGPFQKLHNQDHQHHGTKQHKGVKQHAALSSSDQLLSRLVGSGISLGSATSPALHVTKTPTSSLMEALRAANLADNPTSFLVAADNSNNPSVPFSNLNRGGVVVKSGGSSSVAQSSISAESVSQSPLTQTINTGGGNGNEDAEMRVSAKGAGLDVQGRATTNRVQPQVKLSQQKRPHQGPSESQRQQQQQIQSQKPRRHSQQRQQDEVEGDECDDLDGEQQQEDQQMQSNGEDDNNDGDEDDGQIEGNDDDDYEREGAENYAATTKEAAAVEQFKLARGGGGSSSTQNQLRRLMEQKVNQGTATGACWAPLSSSNNAAIDQQQIMRHQVVQPQLHQNQQHQASYEPAEKGSALQGVDLIAHTLDNHHNLRETYQDMTPSSNINQEISSRSKYGNGQEEEDENLVEEAAWVVPAARHQKPSPSQAPPEDILEESDNEEVVDGDAHFDDENDFVEDSDCSLQDEDERRMLYQPFAKDETLVMPDFTNRGSSGCLNIHPNPMLNPLTYCVSNKDINSLMKILGKKKKTKKNNSTASIRGQNSKKTKQSVVKRVTRNSQPASSASEKVRKSATQAKAQHLTPAQQQTAKTMPAKLAKKPISKAAIEPLKVAKGQQLAAALKRGSSKIASNRSHQHKSNQHQHQAQGDTSLKNYEQEGPQKTQKREDQEDTQSNFLKSGEKKVLRPGSNSKLDPAEAANEDDNLKYQCKICFKRFLHSSALGGHISKAHPGQSRAYNHKKRVRETRELERELHKRTMQVYQDSLNANQSAGASEALENAAIQAAGDATLVAPSESTVAANLAAKAMALSGRSAKNGQQQSQQLNRNTIKRIKKMLVMQDDQYQSLRSKFLGQSTSTSSNQIHQQTSGNPIIQNSASSAGCTEPAITATAQNSTIANQKQVKTTQPEYHQILATQQKNQKQAESGDSDEDDAIVEVQVENGLQQQDEIVSSGSSDDQYNAAKKRSSNLHNLNSDDEVLDTVGAPEANALNCSNSIMTISNKNKIFKYKSQHLQESKQHEQMPANAANACKTMATVEKPTPQSGAGQRKNFKKISMEDEDQERLRLHLTQKMQQIGQDRLRKQAMGQQPFVTSTQQQQQSALTATMVRGNDGVQSTTAKPNHQGGGAK